MKRDTRKHPRGLVSLLLHLNGTIDHRQIQENFCKNMKKVIDLQEPYLYNISVRTVCIYYTTFTQ